MNRPDKASDIRGQQIVTSFWNKPKSKRPDIPWKSYGVSKCQMVFAIIFLLNQLTLM